MACRHMTTAYSGSGQRYKNPSTAYSRPKTQQHSQERSWLLLKCLFSSRALSVLTGAIWFVGEVVIRPPFYAYSLFAMPSANKRSLAYMPRPIRLKAFPNPLLFRCRISQLTWPLLKLGLSSKNLSIGFQNRRPDSAFSGVCMGTSSLQLFWMCWRELIWSMRWRSHDVSANLFFTGLADTWPNRQLSF